MIKGKLFLMVLIQLVLSNCISDQDDNLKLSMKKDIKPSETLCDDLIDNDSDGYIDCDDSDCDADRYCVLLANEILHENTKELCSDGIDNDGDNKIDCDDLNCKAIDVCLPDGENTHKTCTDLVDNDDDGAIDCDDMDCSGIAACLPDRENTTILCIDGLDNDDDGDIDCADDECSGLSVCLAYRCELATQNDSCVSFESDIISTYTLPSNIRSISENGLNMCLPLKNVLNDPIDITFVIDRSMSMRKYDPDMLTSVAVVKAIDTLTARVPKSNVAYFGFAAGVCNGEAVSTYNSLVMPDKLSNAAHLDKLKKKATYDFELFESTMNCGEYNDSVGTSFKSSLVLAKDWSDIISTESPNRQVILFFTDGNPYEEDLTKLDNYIAKQDSTNYPEIYYIGLQNSRYEPLVAMAEKTNGFFKALSDADQIEGIFNQILESAIQTDKPREIEVKNTTTDDWFISTDLPLFEVPPDVMLAPHIMQVKGSDIKFSKGANNVSVTALQNGKPTSIVSNITFDMSDSIVITTGRSAVPGTPFDAICYDQVE
ncbi:MAG: VWA domain-containing protein [Fibrobacterales bacterium]